MMNPLEIKLFIGSCSQDINLVHSCTWGTAEKHVIFDVLLRLGGMMYEHKVLSQWNREVLHTVNYFN